MESIFYKTYKNMVKTLIAHESFKGEEMRGLIEDYRDTIFHIEQQFPEFPERARKEQEIQNTFTDKQIDFICSQIGDWYLEWKGCIASTDGTHRLGLAKEELKTMICGE